MPSLGAVISEEAGRYRSEIERLRAVLRAADELVRAYPEDPRLKDLEAAVMATRVRSNLQ